MIVHNGSVGELFRYERDANGTVVSLFTGGMQIWPIEAYRARTRAGGQVAPSTV